VAAGDSSLPINKRSGPVIQWLLVRMRKQARPPFTKDWAIAEINKIKKGRAHKRPRTTRREMVQREGPAWKGIKKRKNKPRPRLQAFL
jgi:hypothetical protein